MALAMGSRIGAYEVLSAIGAGGMGEVYRARDTKLNRDVALKILPTEFALDADRLARFKREAQVLASLNHPHIAAIYGFEDSAETHALVLELVEGPTLADRIAKGAIPLDEALSIAKQIAEALEAAHEQGIIHRDLKPANVKVREDGTVKVLDFGLAKLADPTAASAQNVSVTASPTITTPAMMTGVGMILGTAAYMSPEQAKGRAVDKRGDIWAFGCVLYEMLIGERAFPGADVSEVLAFVLTREPDWSAVPVATPFAIRQLMRRCLEKDPKRRLRDIGDAFPYFDEQVVEAATVMVPRSQYVWQRPVPALIGLTLAVALTPLSVCVMTRPKSPEALPVSKFELSVPLDIQGIAARPSAALTVSPDGSTIVYVGRTEGGTRLFRRPMNQLQGVPIAGSENGRAPFFSPDGAWIGFEADGTIRRLPLGGGSPQVIAEIPGGSLQGASWGEKGTIVFAGTKTGLFRVSITGGDRKPLTNADAEKGEFHSLPEVLPGERAVLFTSAGGTEVVLLDTHQRRSLLQGTNPHFSPTGHLLFARENSTWAVRFDPVRLKVLSEPIRVLEGIEYFGGAQLAFSQNGTLAYLPSETLRDDITRNARLVIVNREGRATPLPYESGRYLVPRLAPDGRD
jgi:serine/threonine-protein kinase